MYRGLERLVRGVVIVSVLGGACLGGASGAAEITLEELIELVRQNELLYANIDVSMRDSFVSFAERTGGKGRAGPFELRPIIDDEVADRFVLQDGWLRYDHKSSFTYENGEKDSLRAINAFDGETTRILTGGIANIVRGSKPVGIPIRPHGVLLRMNGRSEHLSAFLAGDEAIARDGYGYTDDITVRSTEYVGTAHYQGLRCHVVRSIVRIRKTGEIANHGDLWLAEDRNFIPVRLVGYEHRISASEPTGEGMVLEWKELQPGIWFPMRAVSTSLDQRIALLKGKRQPGWRREYVIESVSLEPKHPRSFFQDVPIPSGTIVYEYDGDKEIRAYQQGAPSGPTGGPNGVGPSWWRRVAASVIVVLVGGVCVYYIVRQRRRRRQRAAP